MDKKYICKYCGNIQKKTYDDNNIYFVCVICNKKEKGDNSDRIVLKLNDKIDINMQRFNRKLQNVHLIPYSMKFDIECPKCKMDYVSGVQNEETMKFTYKCLCGYIFS